MHIKYFKEFFNRFLSSFIRVVRILNGLSGILRCPVIQISPIMLQEDKTQRKKVINFFILNCYFEYLSLILQFDLTDITVP